LSDEETAACFDKIKHGTDSEKKEAKDRLVNCNQRFVLAMARKFGTRKNLLDLIEEGNIGLMEAIDNYDEKHGAKFLSFAVWYVRRAINYFNVRNGNLVRQTNSSKTAHLISKATNRFAQREERNPTTNELMDILTDEYGVDLKEAGDLMQTQIFSLNGYNMDEEEIDVFQYSNHMASDNLCVMESEKEYNRTIYENLVKTLPTREKNVIKLLYGIGYDRPYEMKEVAKLTGVTQERVRQLKKSILFKLQKEAKKIRANA
jgi:RNA polymerase sigma factor (sigma-70 family)